MAIILESLESLEWQSRGAFPALAVKSAAVTFVVQIETFASHIGDIYRSLFVTKTVTFVSHQNVCVTPCATCHNITHVGHTMWGVQDSPSSSRRMLPKFEDFGKQRSVYARGVGGGGEGGHT